MDSFADKSDNLHRHALPFMASKLRGAIARKERRSADPCGKSAAFLSRVKGYDFASCSDLELRQRIGRLKISSASSGDSVPLAEVFAIVNEAVERRMGAWKLFELEGTAQRFARYRQLAIEAIESPAGLEEFAGHVVPSGLNVAERALVNGMAYFLKRSRVDCWSDILMDADFYKALREVDTENQMRFVPSDEQIVAGRLLYQGSIVEMDSGEGKTIAAAFPAALHAICGRAVHIITSNDYLASRDAELLAPVYESLGLTVAYVLGYMSDDEKRHAYGQDIVYGTLREFAFDYLRDNLRMPNEPKVQGPLDAVIVDEADHGLIDQARTPLVISGEPTDFTRGLNKALTAIELLVASQKEHALELETQLDAGPINSKETTFLVARLLLVAPDGEYLGKALAAHPKAYGRALNLIEDESGEPDSRLTAGLSYIVDPRRGSVRLTEEGHNFLDEELGQVFDTSRLESELAAVESRSEIGAKDRKRLRARLRRRIDAQYRRINQLHQLLKAFVLLKRNVDYIVDDGKVVLIDELTGRTLPDNIYHRGLHAAVQAKERIPVEPERETLAQISVQGFIRQYSTAAGMTGTALDAEDEFLSAYGLTVTRMPSTRPRARTDFDTRVYLTDDDKFSAIVDEIRSCHNVGRPVLAGTLTIKQSERLSNLLDVAGIPHNLLSAASDANEAQIVRHAGSVAAVTLATNVAGRGTDIILQPGLNDVIIKGYVDLVQRLLSEGVDPVQLDCSSVDERSLMSAALSDAGNCFLTEPPDAGEAGTALTVSTSPGATRAPAARVEFALGLHVIGTELNESSRIDWQLRGRSGRQGAPGTTRFIVSMEDELLAYRRGEASYVGDISKADTDGRTYYEGGGVQHHIQRLQSHLSEDEAFERHVLNEYTRVQEAQTADYYKARRQVFNVDSFHGVCQGHLQDVARRLVQEFLPDLGISDYLRQFQQLSAEVGTEFGIDIRDLEGVSALHLADSIADLMEDALDEVCERIGEERLDSLERQLYLQTSDEHWRDHIGNMQELMLSVSFTGHGIKHSTAEYTFHSYEAYQRLKRDVADDFVHKLFRFPIEDLVQPKGTTRVLEGETAGILA